MGSAAVGTTEHRRLRPCCSVFLENTHKHDHRPWNQRSSGRSRKYGRAERCDRWMPGQDAECDVHWRCTSIRGQPDDSGSARTGEAGCRAGREPEQSPPGVPRIDRHNLAKRPARPALCDLEAVFRQQARTTIVPTVALRGQGPRLVTDRSGGVWTRLAPPARPHVPPVRSWRAGGASHAQPLTGSRHLLSREPLLSFRGRRQPSGEPVPGPRASLLGFGLSRKERIARAINRLRVAQQRGLFR